MIGTVVWCDGKTDGRICRAQLIVWNRKVTAVRKQLAVERWTVRANPRYPNLRAFDFSETFCPHHNPNAPEPTKENE